MAETVTVGEGRIGIHDLERENKNANPELDFDSLDYFSKDEKGACYRGGEPVDITGGYLLEETPDWRMEDSEAYFKTDLCN